MASRGFTFIEILIVITIISIVSVFSFTSFFQFLGRQDLEQGVSLFSTKLEKLSSALKNKEILNYKVTLLTGAGYFYEENKKSLFLSPVSVDFSVGSFSLSGNILYPSTAKIQEFRDGKYKGEKFLSWGGFYSGTFSLLSEEKYIVFADDSEKNTFGISYYSFPVDKNEAKNLTLSSVFTGPNKTGVSLTGVTLSGYYGKLKIQKFDGTELPSVYLNFQKGGKEYILPLSN